MKEMLAIAQQSFKTRGTLAIYHSFVLQIFIEYCYRLNTCIPPNYYVETSSPMWQYLEVEPLRGA